MQIPRSTLTSLSLSMVAGEVIAGRYDKFPPLLLDTCLEDAVDVLVQQSIAVGSAGYPAMSETLTMPRRNFGPRPVIITSPVVRTLYYALVGKLSQDLPSDMRSSEKWEAHNEFGVPKEEPSEISYRVDLDIASCYEYIEHSRLSNELILRTSQVDEVSALIQLLSEVTGRDRGLPQLASASDILADIYLEVIERHMSRLGYEQSRMADDFKFIVEDWGDANQVIEDTAECAREIGLVLSTEKTKIRKSKTVYHQHRDERDFLVRHFRSVFDEMTKIYTIWNAYDDVFLEEVVTPEDQEVIKGGFLAIFTEWQEGLDSDKSEEVQAHTNFFSLGLQWLEDYGERLADKTLQDIVFHYPLKLEGVCRYLLARTHEKNENWVTLKGLTSMRRQSPWAKIWMLHVASRLPFDASWAIDQKEEVERWAIGQLDDKHETVRVEAAWYLSKRSLLAVEDLAGLFSTASSLTRPAVAACIGRSGFDKKNRIVKAVLREGKLAKAAYEWGFKQHG